jgi:hypothetical protein
MRRLIVDAGRHWRRSSIVYGLTEFDITGVRARISAHKQRTGETLSLTAYVAACLARAVGGPFGPCVPQLAQSTRHLRRC